MRWDEGKTAILVEDMKGKEKDKRNEIDMVDIETESSIYRNQ